MKDEKWLRACENTAQIFSTCDKRKYAAFVLAPNGRVVGFGYNGSPPGHPHCDQGACPRLYQNSPHGSTYDNCIANHAEANALIWSDINARQGGTLIVNGPPCYGCSKLIASSGISRLVHYIDPTYQQWTDCMELLLKSKVEIVSVPYPTPQYFTTTEAFPPTWTQVKTSWNKHEPLTPQNCDIDNWESPSGTVYQGLIPDHPNHP
jgi:dCMP deaminase